MLFCDGYAGGTIAWFSSIQAAICRRSISVNSVYGAVHLDATKFVQTPNWQWGKFIV